MRNSVAIIATLFVLSTTPIEVHAQNSVSDKIHSLCYSGWDIDIEPHEYNEFRDELNAGKAVPLGKQGPASIIIGNDTLKLLTASEARSLGVTSGGSHYLIGICQAGTPPIQSTEAFEKWANGIYVEYNIDPTYKRVLTTSVFMGPVGNPTIVYYTFPAKGRSLDRHEHFLTGIG